MHSGFRGAKICVADVHFQMYLHARAKFSPDRSSDFEAFTRFVEGTIPRSIHICMPNLVMIGPAVWPLIVDTHARTHTHTHTRARAHAT